MWLKKLAVAALICYSTLAVFTLCAARRRHADTPCAEHFSGRSDWMPEHPRGDEPTELQAGDEHLLRPAAHRQHVRSLRQVQLTQW